MKKRFVLAVSILFYAGMLVMTFSARALHNAGLPRVKVMEIGYEVFTDGEGKESFSAALPKKIYHGGELYVISGAYINDEYRAIARRVESLELGLENEDYYQVKDGINAGNQVIIGGVDGIIDGCEVYILEEGEEADGE